MTGLMHFTHPYTPQAALQALRAVRPSEYARTRNHIGGAVTRLSPYLTHGLLQMPDVMAALELRREHKLVFELGWREFFHHAWRHDGQAIFESLHEGPLPDAAYARELPADIREGRTRRAGDRPGRARALRHRLRAQPRPHVARVVHRAPAQGALARRRRLALRASARRRSGEQPPVVAMGGRHRQPQAVSVQRRERAALCGRAVAQRGHGDRHELRRAGSHRAFIACVGC